MNEYVLAVLELLASLATFLVSFKLLSDSIEKLAHGKLKNIFKKNSKNRFLGVLIGIFITIVLNSSGATTVMVVGFVNANIMDLYQAAAIIMGSNIGTTLTAQIVALNSVDLSIYLIALSFIGILGALFCKKEKSKAIFNSIGGLGLVFFALHLMSASMQVFKTSPVFIDALANISNPFLLFAIGILLTVLLQSSTAVTTIIISMAASGILIGNGGNSYLYLVLGTNIGSCATALLSSIGARTNAKRASLIHLLFNVSGSIIFFIFLLCYPGFSDDVLARLFPQPATQIAMFHTFFNVISTILFFPFIKTIVSIVSFIVKDKKAAGATYLDERFYNTPAIAIEAAKKETQRIGNMAKDVLLKSIDTFLDKKEDNYQIIRESIALLDGLSNEVISYLVKVKTKDDDLHKEMSALHEIIIDFTRQGEIADNFIKYTKTAIEKEIVFSDIAICGIKQIQDKLDLQFSLINKLFEESNKEVLKTADNIEDQIDELRTGLLNGHIQRLEEGKCSPSSNTVYISLVSNLERAGDHLNYICHELCD